MATEHKIIEGDKSHVEKEMNRLDGEGWMLLGNKTIVERGSSFVYSVLMTRYTPEDKS